VLDDALALDQLLLRAVKVVVHKQALQELRRGAGREVQRRAFRQADRR
jgi:hypothetical protein